MTIDLETHVAIRHPDLGRIAHAVLHADEHDEAHWIEWKSNLDLSSKKGVFPIARTILGMANRMPAAASLVCGGLGYIVVGVEPGNLHGVATVDPAELDRILEPWLGGVDGPRYTPSYVRVGSKTALIVVVEAPGRGDPVFPLRKEFEAGRDGDVFVRKQGHTERANSADLRALVERAADRGSAPPDLEVSLVGDVPLPWFDPTNLEGIVAAWVEGRRRAMVSAAQGEESRRHPESTPTNRSGSTSFRLPDSRQQEQLLRAAGDAARELAPIASVAGFAHEPDRRTIDEFLAEVEVWCEDALTVGAAVLVDRYLQAGHGLIAVRVRNPTGRYLRKVMVEVHIEWEAASSPEPDWPECRFPAEPRAYGTATPSALSRTLSTPPSVLGSLMSPVAFTPAPARSWTEEGSVRIVFEVGDLRQEDSDTSEDHHIFISDRPSDGILHCTWKATVPDVHGVMRGTLQVPVREVPVELRDLVDLEPSDDEG